MECLFCSDFEKKYKPESGNDFICSQCVQLMLGAEQEDLKQAYDKAIEKGFPLKARAIESFLIPEEFNVRETKKSQRGFIRKKPVRVVRPSRDELRP